MISTLLNLTLPLIRVKKDETSINNNNLTTHPVVETTATQVYFDDCPSLTSFYPNNNRPQFKKWVATKIFTGKWGYSDTNPSFFVWNFENNGSTRFLQNAGNRGGNEAFSIALKNMSRIPVAGSYQMDIDYIEGFCWYGVYNASGTLHDSTRRQGINNSVFNITSMVFDRAVIPTVDRYKMTGNATFNIMYWANGANSATDIHKLRCIFNNIPVDVMK